ncbi:MAG: assimilatory sulfite reductase (NADPH) flavoprotein subunit [Proteobacteria bacterium]|nr:assimilatory sulfite reductase (NADPH) flavoprotein subunit [Pseudomonadota bacterium]
MHNMAASAVAPPLDLAQTQKVRSALDGLTPAQLQWVSGYAAGLAARNETLPSAIAETATDPSNTMTILYGSQTGNGRAIAEELKQSAVSRGFAVRLFSLADYRPANIKRETLISLVVSTHGEGDPPDDAELFHEFLLSGKAPPLKQLKYSVLALGDSSYVNFCQTGRDLDARLSELGAARFVPTIECDLDYDETVAAWADDVLEALPKVLESVPSVPRLHAVKRPAVYNRHRPFEAVVLTNQKITGANSTKDVRHIELSLEDSGLIYEPGDSLAVIADNPPQLVEELLETLDFSGSEEVEVQGAAFTIRDALRAKLEITVPNLGFLKAYAELADSQDLRDLLQPERQAELSVFLEARQIIDIVREYAAPVSAAEFAASLRKLMPRSYSIASSPLANPDEVHLTVASVNYQAFGTEHWGAASTMLADRIAEGDKVSVFVEPNPRFRLPADGQTPVIMIGPGTGVAPFRAFVEQRAELGATGKNWLFFGDRTFHSDFLYQLEWQRFLKRGVLHRMDVAFSRDQADKVYVQHRIEEQGAEVYRWLQQGAVIYVCGDAKHMAGDVHNALVNALVAHGGHDIESARIYLKDLRRAGRYQRDVY